MRVLLRCDASIGGGVGHLVRCLALAEAADERGWEVTLAGTFDAPLARRLLASARVEVVEAATTTEGLAAQARGLEADVLHVDHYDVGADLRGRMNDVVLSSIEDGTFGRRPADVVVDSTPGAQDAGRPHDGSAQVLLGVRHAPLRAAVRAARERAPRPARPGEPGDVLVVMGGTDPYGAAVPAAALARQAGAGRVVVVGDEATGVRARAAVPGVEVLGPVDDLPGLATTVDVVISAAGTSVWELACVGAPTALVPVTGNQRTGYERAVAAGIAIGLGTLDELRSGAAGAQAALAALLADHDRQTSLAAAGRDLVDGHGADRILDAWWATLGRPAPVARRATARDRDLLLVWRNDPGTRASSRTTDPVTPGSHARWFDGVLADPDRLLLVVEHADRPVGTVRFDRQGEGLWEVSVTLAPRARGQGLAAPVLAAAETLWRSHAGEGPAVLACVRPDNTASAALFRRAGYLPVPAPEPDGLLAYRKPGSAG